VRGEVPEGDLVRRRTVRSLIRSLLLLPAAFQKLENGWSKNSPKPPRRTSFELFLVSHAKPTRGAQLFLNVSKKGHPTLPSGAQGSAKDGGLPPSLTGNTCVTSVIFTLKIGRTNSPVVYPSSTFVSYYTLSDRLSNGVGQRKPLKSARYLYIFTIRQ